MVLLSIDCSKMQDHGQLEDMSLESVPQELLKAGPPSWSPRRAPSAAFPLTDLAAAAAAACDCASGHLVGGSFEGLPLEGVVDRPVWTWVVPRSPGPSPPSGPLASPHTGACEPLAAPRFPQKRKGCHLPVIHTLRTTPHGQWTLGNLESFVGAWGSITNPSWDDVMRGEEERGTQGPSRPSLKGEMAKLKKKLKGWDDA
jgi:hypothetical protein